MMLDDYRLKLIVRLLACRDASRARALIEEADLMLTSTSLTPATQDEFWENVQEDLDAMGDEAKYLSDRSASVLIDSIATAARARIASYRTRIRDTLSAPKGSS